MDVHLLVYDLSRGLARQMSAGLLGFQLDAIYHTSIELNGREYVYDGGIIAIAPGSSHLGQPMEKIHLGTTNLPMDVIEEFLDSLRPIFTLEVPIQISTRQYCHPANLIRPMTSSITTATTLATHSQISSSEKEFRNTSSRCLKLSSTHPWVACCFPSSLRESMLGGKTAPSSAFNKAPRHPRLQSTASRMSPILPSLIA